MCLLGNEGWESFLKVKSELCLCLETDVRNFVRYLQPKLNEKQKFAASLTFWLLAFELAGPRTCGHGDVGDPGCEWPVVIFVPKENPIILFSYLVLRALNHISWSSSAGGRLHVMWTMFMLISCEVVRLYHICQQWCFELWVSVFPRLYQCLGDLLCDPPAENKLKWKKSCIMSDRGRKEEIRSTSVWTVLLKPSETWLWVSRVSRCFTLTRLYVWL